MSKRQVRRDEERGKGKEGKDDREADVKEDTYYWSVSFGSEGR